MATRDDDSFTLISGIDLTAKEGAFGKVSGATIIACTALGERADVVIGSAVGSGLAVDCFPRAGRKVIVKVGAVAVAAGVELTTDANGFAITAVSTNIVRAKAIAAGAIGAYIEVLWVDAYAKP